MGLFLEGACDGSTSMFAAAWETQRRSAGRGPAAFHPDTSTALNNAH